MEMSKAENIMGLFIIIGIAVALLIFGIGTNDWLIQNHKEYKICSYVQENKICDYTQPNLRCSYFGKKEYIISCFKAVDKESSGVGSTVAYYVTEKRSSKVGER